jgi:hypothetical protein
MVGTGSEICRRRRTADDLAAAVLERPENASFEGADSSSDRGHRDGDIGRRRSACLHDNADGGVRTISASRNRGHRQTDIGDGHRTLKSLA